MTELIVYQDPETKIYSIQENDSEQPHCWLGPDFDNGKFCFVLRGECGIWETKDKIEAEKWLGFLKNEMLPLWVLETYKKIRNSFPYDVSVTLTNRFEGKMWAKDTYGNWYRQSDDLWTIRILSSSEMSLTGPNGEVVRINL